MESEQMLLFLLAFEDICYFFRLFYILTDAEKNKPTAVRVIRD